VRKKNVTKTGGGTGLASRNGKNLRDFDERKHLTAYLGNWWPRSKLARDHWRKGLVHSPMRERTICDMFGGISGKSANVGGGKLPKREMRNSCELQALGLRRT